MGHIFSAVDCYCHVVISKKIMIMLEIRPCTYPRVKLNHSRTLSHSFELARDDVFYRVLNMRIEYFRLLYPTLQLVLGEFSTRELMVELGLRTPSDIIR